MPAVISDSLIDQALSLKRKGFKLNEIAEKLQKPITTVKNWVYSTKPDKALTVNALANRVERIVLKKVGNPEIQQQSSQARSLLAKEALQQAKLLSKSRLGSVKELFTSPDGQGRTALLKQLGESCSTIFGWDADKQSSMLTMQAPRDIEATVSQEPLQSTTTRSVEASPQLIESSTVVDSK